MRQYEQYAATRSWWANNLADREQHRTDAWGLVGYRTYYRDELLDKLVAVKPPKVGREKKVRVTLGIMTVWLTITGWADGSFLVQGRCRDVKEEKPLKTWEQVQRDNTLGGLRA